MAPCNFLVVLAMVIFANCVPINKRDEGSQCVNIYGECPEWKNAGFCEQHEDYMRTTCPLTCGFCKEVPAYKESYSAQYQPYSSSSSSVEIAPTASQPASMQTQQSYTSQEIQPLLSTNSSTQTNETQNGKIEKETKDQKDEGKEKKAVEKEKNVKDVKSETNSDELDSMPDDDLATNEQTQPSSKHIENETGEQTNALKSKETTGKSNQSKNNLKSHEEINESGFSGSGQSLTSDRENAAIFLRNKDAVYRDFIVEDNPDKLTNLVKQFHNSNSFNENVPSSSETANEVQEQEDNGSAEVVEESGSSGDESSGVKKSNEDEENESQTKNADRNKEDDKKAGGKATEQEKTENAEKYQDEEKEEKQNSKKPVQQKKKNLMEAMLENGSLKAVSVSKGKTRQRVPVHYNKETENEGDDEEEDATNIDLDFKETGLEQFSGSGDDGKLHLTLRQNFDSKYEDKTTPAYKILSGNFEKDMGEALGSEDAVSDVSFSEVEVEGNPRTTGKVRVNFNFNGDYNKLQKIVKSGSVNGLLVLKNSLEGPMLNLEESE